MQGQDVFSLFKLDTAVADKVAGVFALLLEKRQKAIGNFLEIGIGFFFGWPREFKDVSYVTFSFYDTADFFVCSQNVFTSFVEYEK